MSLKWARPGRDENNPDPDAGEKRVVTAVAQADIAQAEVQAAYDRRVVELKREKYRRTVHYVVDIFTDVLAALGYLFGVACLALLAWLLVLIISKVAGIDVQDLVRR